MLGELFQRRSAAQIWMGPEGGGGERNGDMQGLGWREGGGQDSGGTDARGSGWGGEGEARKGNGRGCMDRACNQSWAIPLEDFRELSPRWDGYKAGRRAGWNEVDVKFTCLQEVKKLLFIHSFINKYLLSTGHPGGSVG